ncbi:hypothetical protein C8R45DRAFT_236827 [Mycena sanguinolenta]|nr:hypothetical protein C8R45DRAFT_236827 [Mycena sanguinolenta]
MPISDPSDLVAEFKKSGEFDKLRRELLANSQLSGGFEAFKARVEEIARERLGSGQMAYTAPEPVHKELMQEINRFPIVERFASEVPMLSDSAFKDGIRASLQRILREDRGQKDPPAPAEPPSQPSVPPPADSGSSVKEGEGTPVSPVLPLQEPTVVPLVPLGTAPEAQAGKETDVDTINLAPLTDAPETVMSSPKSSPLSSPPGPS